ncbi:MAG: hypothetical protein HY718_06850 [Planctomycetes bacterium]|nr:hypothetical protein [Planctomycetota bacterium]
MRTIGAVCVFFGTTVLTGAWAAPPPGSAVRILSPRFFPGWQSQNVCYPFVVPEQAGTYRMFYTGSASEQWNESNAEQWVTGYVTSTDTITWKFPENYEQVLFARQFMEADLVDPAEMAAVFDSMFAAGACVIKEGGVYKAWYTGWNGEFVHQGGGLCDKINFRVGYATSPDGIRWTKVAGTAGAGSVLGLGSTGEPDAKGAANPHVLKIGGEHRMWYEGYDGQTRRIMLATSADGITWTKQGVVLNPGGANAKDERGLANPMVIFRSGQYELWYQGKSQSSPNYHVLRATSTDDAAWTKIAAEVTLHPDSPIAGSELIHVNSAIVLADGSVQVFFAKQITTARTVAYATLNSRNFHVYTEVVNP